MSEKEIQNTTALAAQALTQDKAQAYELVGMIKAFDFTQKLVTVTTLKIINEVKKTKSYKGLEIMNPSGELVTVTTFKDFCACLGLSVETVDRNLLNLNVLGEEFLETSQRLGLGYREMRKLRQLPEDARAEIVEADYSEATDKEELLERIEDLTAKHAKEKAELESKLKRKTDDYDAQAQVLANRNERINKLDAELAKKEQWFKNLTPEQKGEALREEAGKLGYKIEAQVRTTLRSAFITLSEHQQESGADHKQFMTGLLAQIEVAINELYGAFRLDKTHYTGYEPRWIAETRNENDPTFEPDEFEFEEA